MAPCVRLTPPKISAGKVFFWFWSVSSAMKFLDLRVVRPNMNMSNVRVTAPGMWQHPEFCLFLSVLLSCHQEHSGQGRPRPSWPWARFPGARAVSGYAGMWSGAGWRRWRSFRRRMRGGGAPGVGWQGGDARAGLPAACAWAARLAPVGALPQAPML